MWTLIITLLLSGDPLTLTIQTADLVECHERGRQLETQYLTRPARSFSCVRGRVE